MGATEEAAGLLGAGGLGGLVGGIAVRSAGLTAAGMVGGGAGIGAPAGPVGVAVGVLTGLALYGVVRLGRDVFTAASYDSGITYRSCSHCGHDHYTFISGCAHWDNDGRCKCTNVPTDEDA